MHIERVDDLLTEYLMDNEVGKRPDRSRANADSIGKLLFEAGRLTAEDAERVVEFQRVNNLRFGEAALALGLINQDDIQFALARQFDSPYLAPGQTSFSSDLVAAYSPNAPEAEAFRILRTQVLLRWFNAGNKTLLMCGAEGGEGVSYHVANLAVVCSQLGEKTLIIDANFRTPRQHVVFNLGNNRQGLSDVLAGRATKFVYKFASLPGLSVIPSGTSPPNPAELLSRRNFGVLLRYLSNRYDMIIIDAPPINVYADTQSISAVTKGAVLVARLNASRVAQLEKAKRLLLSTRAEIVGAVLVRTQGGM